MPDNSVELNTQLDMASVSLFNSTVVEVVKKMKPLKKCSRTISP